MTARYLIVAALLAGVASAQAADPDPSVSRLIGIPGTPRNAVAPLDIPAQQQLLGELAKPAVHVIWTDQGGRLHAYNNRYMALNKAGNRIRIMGSCESACTLVLQIPMERICFGEWAQLRFHMPRNGDETPAPDSAA